MQFALAALETAHVPLLVHREQVVAVRDPPAAACTQGHAIAVHALQRLQITKLGTKLGQVISLIAVYNYFDVYDQVF